jgi:hypothetical protein
MADEHPEIELTLIVEKIKKFKTGGSDANESPVAGGGESIVSRWDISPHTLFRR